MNNQEWDEIIEEIFDVNIHDTRYEAGVAILYTDMLKHKYKDMDREKLGTAASQFISETLEWHEKRRWHFEINPLFETRILEIMNKSD